MLPIVATATRYLIGLIATIITTMTVVGGIIIFINFLIEGVLEAISQLASAVAKAFVITAGTYALPSLYGSIYQATTVLAPVSQTPLGYGELASVFSMIGYLRQRR